MSTSFAFTRRLVHPHGGETFVLWVALPAQIHDAEHEFGAGVAAFDQGLKFKDSAFEIAGVVGPYSSRIFRRSRFDQREGGNQYCGSRKESNQAGPQSVSYTALRAIMKGRLEPN